MAGAVTDDDKAVDLGLDFCGTRRIDLDDDNILALLGQPVGEVGANGPRPDHDDSHSHLLRSEPAT